MIFVMNAEKVAFQICFFDFVLSDSTLKWIPSASESESAIAIVSTPPITINLLFVDAESPISKPSVVIMADVSPKLTPIFIEGFHFFIVC